MYLIWYSQKWLQNPLAGVFGHLWTIFQILLFGLVGALVNINDLEWTTVGMYQQLAVINSNYR